MIYVDTSSLLKLVIPDEHSMAVEMLAAMEELGIKRLMTHDLRQVEAARELGYAVDSPGL